jgi:hypothetical protein
MRIPKRKPGYGALSMLAWALESQGTPARWRPLAQPIRRMNLAGAPVTCGYCPRRFSLLYKTCILLGIPTRTVPVWVAAHILGVVAT